MTPLDPKGIDDLRARFGDGGDGLIRRFDYDFAHAVAQVELSVRTPAGEWVNLGFQLEGVAHWRANHTNESHWQVLSDGFSLIHEGQWYLDLGPDFSRPPSAQVINESAFYICAQAVSFEERAYDYPRPA